MPKPSLREVFDRHDPEAIVPIRKFASWVSDMLEALVEAVEPEDTPTDQQYNDARDDRIRFLQEKLAEAQAEIELLHKQGDYLLNMRTSDYHARAAAERELTKAKAEIEELRAELMTDVQGLMANAKIGELVRGMAIDTRLGRWTVDRYQSWRWSPNDGKWEQTAFADTPAEALRAIQEKGADES